MRCIRAVCLLFATLWGFTLPAQDVGFRMKSVSPDFLWKGASAAAGTFANVNSVSETLYFPADHSSVPVCARRLSDARVQSFGGGTYTAPNSQTIHSEAGTREQVSAGGGIAYSQPLPPQYNTDLPAEEIPAAAVQRQPRKTVAYGNSRYYTVEAQQHTATASAYPVYRPMLTQVGAQQATAMAWTSESATAPIRRSNGTDDDWTDLTSPTQSDKSPVGEAWALLAFALLYAGYTFLHRKKTKNLNKSTF